MIRARQAVVALVGALLCAVMVLLGLWQMQVFESQKSQTTAARLSQAPVDLESNLYQGKVGDLYGRRVTATGHYLAADTELVGTGWPLRVVTAFRTTGGRTLAVVRGTVAKGQAVPKPPTGTQQVLGVILPSETDSTGEVGAGLPSGTQASLQLEHLVQAWPSPMLDGFLTLPADAAARQGLAAAPVTVPDTAGGRARNQGYALQWWAFAIFTAGATVVGVRSAGRRPGDSAPDEG